MNLNELKRLAREAQAEVGIVPGPKRMAFVRAANPAAVLDLLSEREEDQGVIRVWRGRTERAEAERDALKAENERLRARLERVESKVREFSHAEACAVDDTYDPDDTDGCVCVLRVLAE